MQIVMILLCLAWGMAMGVLCRNFFLAIALGGAGGYIIGQIFQQTGLLG